jgi:hypothetical protein
MALEMQRIDGGRANASAGSAINQRQKPKICKNRPMSLGYGEKLFDGKSYILCHPGRYILFFERFHKHTLFPPGGIFGRGRSAMNIELVVFLIIVIAGILGGSANYLTEEKKTDGSGIALWLNRVIVGIVAAFLIPLFLETMSSDLLKNILSKTDEAIKDYFVFFGFCLLGAISSRLLIQTLSEKIFQLAKDAKLQADKANAKTQELDAVVAPFVERGTEEESPEGGKIIAPKTIRSSARMDKEADEVLSALNHPKYTLRSASGISADTNLDKSVVSEKLKTLTAEGLASELEDRGKGIRWAITG